MIRKYFSVCQLLIFFLIIDFACFSQNNTKQFVIDLSGTWHFNADPGDVGVLENWYNKNLKDSVALPGSMTQNGKGDDVTLQTKWTGSIYDSSFFFRPSMAKYRQPGNGLRL